MIAASAVGIFLIPVLYVVFQRLREKIKEQSAEGDPAADRPAAADATPTGH